MSYIKRITGRISHPYPAGLLCLAVALILAGLLSHSGGNPARALLGRSGWLLVVGLAGTGITLRPASPLRLSRVIGCLVLYAGLAAGEAANGGTSGLGKWLTSALGLTHGGTWTALALAIGGIGIGLPLWGGRKWPDLLEYGGERIESFCLAAWRRLSPAPSPPPARSAFQEPAAASTPAVQAESPQEVSSAPMPAAAAPAQDLEVIDFDWIMANLEQRYRKKTPDAVPSSGAKQAVMMDVEAVRRRVLDIHGGQLPGQARRRPPAAGGPVTDPIIGAAMVENRPFATKPGTSTTQIPAKAPARGILKDSLYGLGQTQPAPARVAATVDQPPAPPAAAEIEKAIALTTAPLRNELPPLALLPQHASSELSQADQDEPMVSVEALPIPGEQAPAAAWIPPEDLPVLLSAAPSALDETMPAAILAPIEVSLPADAQELSALLVAVPATAAKRVEFHSIIIDRDTPTMPTIAAAALGPPRHALPRPQVEAARPRHSTETYAPPLDLLQPANFKQDPVNQEELDRQGVLIQERLAEFRVNVSVLDACAGPVITRYEVAPAVGVRGSQVVNLMKDLARALGVTAIRVVETIPGKTCMGLELPNPRRQMICLSEVLSADVFQHHASKLAMALGKDIMGNPVVIDLAKAPHLLVAGTTGSGKSVGVNAMIVSMLYRATPAEVRFIMIDPKMLELSVYDGIPHLLAPVVTDMKLAANALNWCVGEMERRYRLMSTLGVRNLAGYNQKVAHAQHVGRPLVDPFSITPDSPAPLTHLPFIVVVVDEFADLMMVAGKKIEELIARLAQKARAAGIHLILATQRPSVDVITGLIKANIPTRIAFQVSSKIDSRTILDQMGAEALLGQGDMLYLPPGTGYPQRIHGAFVADDEVHALAEHLKLYGEPDYLEAVLGGPAEAEGAAAEAESAEADPLYDEAVAIVINTRRASISLVQRQLRIGYNRAARLVEQMEVAGVVSPMESNGNRTVLAPG